jgi:hypothetical protein
MKEAWLTALIFDGTFRSCDVGQPACSDFMLSVVGIECFFCYSWKFMHLLFVIIGTDIIDTRCRCLHDYVCSGSLDCTSSHFE